MQTIPKTPTLIVPAGASRATRIQSVIGHIQATADIPMEPTEYVNDWVQHPLSQQRYGLYIVMELFWSLRLTCL